MILIEGGWDMLPIALPLALIGAATLGFAMKALSMSGVLLGTACICAAVLLLGGMVI